jgi:hypothetical protein
MIAKIRCCIILDTQESKLGPETENAADSTTESEC